MAEATSPEELGVSKAFRDEATSSECKGNDVEGGNLTKSISFTVIGKSPSVKSCKHREDLEDALSSVNGIFNFFCVFFSPFMEKPLTPVSAGPATPPHGLGMLDLNTIDAANHFSTIMIYFAHNNRDLNSMYEWIDEMKKGVLTDKEVSAIDALKETLDTLPPVLSALADKGFCFLLLLLANIFGT